MFPPFPGSRLGRHAQPAVDQFGWQRLTFSPTISIFGSTYSPSVQRFVAKANQRLEVDAEIYGSGGGSNLVVSADGVHGYNLAQQSDGNQVIYFQNGSSASVLGSASGSNSNNTYNGVHNIRAAFNITATNNRLMIWIENWSFNGQNAFLDGNVSLIGTITVYVIASDVTKSLVRARLLG